MTKTINFKMPLQSDLNEIGNLQDYYNKLTRDELFVTYLLFIQKHSTSKQMITFSALLTMIIASLLFTFLYENPVIFSILIVLLVLVEIALLIFLQKKLSKYILKIIIMEDILKISNKYRNNGFI